MPKLLSLFLLTFMLFGCTTKQTPEPQKSTTPSKPKMSYYSNETVGYKLQYNKDWKVAPPSTNTDIIIISNDGSFSPDPCLSINSVKIDKYDLWDKSNQTKISKEIAPNLKPAEEHNITLAGDHAYNLVYGLERDGISIIFNQTYLFHNGYFIVITCSSREEEYNRFNTIFNQLIKSIDFY